MFHIFKRKVRLLLTLHLNSIKDVDINPYILHLNSIIYDAGWWPLLWALALLVFI